MLTLTLIMIVAYCFILRGTIMKLAYLALSREWWYLKPFGKGSPFNFAINLGLYLTSY